MAEVIPVDRGRIFQDPRYVELITSQLANLDADVVLNSVYSRDVLSDVLSAACKAPKKVGFWGDLCNQSAEDREKHASIYTHLIETRNEHQPEVVRHQEFISAIGGKPSPHPLALHLTSSELTFADTFYRDNGLEPKKTIIFGAFSNEAIKNYPHWAEALAELARKLDYSLVALGASVDRDGTQEILDQLSTPTLNLCGETNLRESAALIAQSRFVLAVDTSIPHLAVAVGTPNLVLLGGGHFGRFFPYSPLTSVICSPLACFGCRWRCPYTVSHCVSDIRPQAVAAATLNSIQNMSAKARVYIQEDELQTQENPPSQAPDKWIKSDDVELLNINEIIIASEIRQGPSTLVEQLNEHSPQDNLKQLSGSFALLGHERDGCQEEAVKRPLLPR